MRLTLLYYLGTMDDTCSYILLDYSLTLSKNYLIAPMLVKQHLGTWSNLNTLTHERPDKIASIFQTIFSDAFSWITVYDFQFECHWTLFLKVQLQYPSIGSDNGLAPAGRQAIVWSNAG